MLIRTDHLIFNGMQIFSYFLKKVCLTTGITWREKGGERKSHLPSFASLSRLLWKNEQSQKLLEEGQTVERYSTAFWGSLAESWVGSMTYESWKDTGMICRHGRQWPVQLCGNICPFSSSSLFPSLLPSFFSFFKNPISSPFDHRG